MTTKPTYILNKAMYATLSDYNTSQLINAYYLAYESGLVSSVNLNGYRSSSITKDALLQICRPFPPTLLEEAKTISRAEAFKRYEVARLKNVS